ncbi:hypothetical protein ACTMTJ_40720 [Phytohabitans sp. LJ34]|uniref:hypothetical protein n=1 Tax=Phytohabitans sp. LJ34 TaxID=3452217 RepID=UPI003F8896FC
MSRDGGLGLIGMCAGVAGVFAGLVWIGYPPAVDDSVYSYPFTATGFTIAQVVLTIRDLGLAVLLIALGTSGAVGRSWLGRIGIAGSVLAMVGLAAMEIVSLAAKDSTDTVGAGYGLASIAAGLFLILTGIAVLRAKTWTGWRRYLPLALGIYVFAPLTPGIVAGFGPGQVVIAGWMLLFAILGWTLAESPSGRATLPDAPTRAAR